MHFGTIGEGEMGILFATDGEFLKFLQWMVSHSCPGCCHGLLIYDICAELSQGRSRPSMTPLPCGRERRRIRAISGDGVP